MNNITEIVYILDRSGSMSGLEEDTIGGFNSMIDKQKETNEKALVSTILFNNKTTVLHDRLTIDKVNKMTSKEYYVGGCTALLDAIGGSIKHIGNIHKYARKEDVSTKTIFIITTDGMENASRNYSYEEIHKMIKRQKEKYGWEFIFIGANIDSVKEAERFGIDKGRTVNYMHDSIGTVNLYAGVSKAVCSVMKAKSTIEMSANLDSSCWDKEIRLDYNKRSKH